jgi:hypothetical protein
MPASVVTVEVLDLEISVAHIALRAARGLRARCPSGENEQRVQEAEVELDRILDQRLIFQTAAR